MKIRVIAVFSALYFPMSFFFATGAFAQEISEYPQIAGMDAPIPYVSPDAPSPIVAGEPVELTVPEQVWTVPENARLRQTLARWSDAANWTLVWDAPGDYRLRAGSVFGGNFVEAATRLADAVYQTNPELEVRFYGGNRVVHVSAVTN